jgi:large subunit ribosomal protein L18
MAEHRAKKTIEKRERRERAHRRVRQRVRGTAERPRLSVYKSLRYVYAQVIDDERGVTIAQASSKESALVAGLEAGTGGRDAAKRVGEAIAERAREKGVQRVVFDRGGYIYHGKVRAVAEGARDKGLEF